MDTTMEPEIPLTPLEMGEGAITQTTQDVNIPQENNEIINQQQKSKKMSTRPTKSEGQMLQDCGIGLTNVSEQPIIAAAMEEVGYDAAKIQEGKDLLQTALDSYNKNKTEGDESSAAHNIFENKRSELAGIYARHRKITKVVFKNDPNTLSRLRIDGSMPQAYTNWLLDVKKFYTEATTDPAIPAATSRLKLTAQHFTDAAALIPQLEQSRASYVKENGESQQATKDKDAALSAIDNWMKEFYAVAKIALEDQPQLLESIAKFVRS